MLCTSKRYTRLLQIYTQRKAETGCERGTITRASKQDGIASVSREVSPITSSSGFPSIRAAFGCGVERLLWVFELS